VSTIKSQHRRECGVPATVKQGDRFVRVWSYTLSLKAWARAKIRRHRSLVCNGDIEQATRDSLPCIVDWALSKGIRA
jgi:hypothetical protein